jgi:hypothetical protein
MQPLQLVLPHRQLVLQLVLGLQPCPLLGRVALPPLARHLVLPLRRFAMQLMRGLAASSQLKNGTSANLSTGSATLGCNCYSVRLLP